MNCHFFFKATYNHHNQIVPRCKWIKKLRDIPLYLEDGHTSLHLDPEVCEPGPALSVSHRLRHRDLKEVGCKYCHWRINTHKATNEKLKVVKKKIRYFSMMYPTWRAVGFIQGLSLLNNPLRWVVHPESGKNKLARCSASRVSCKCFIFFHHHLNLYLSSLQSFSSKWVENWSVFGCQVRRPQSVMCQRLLGVSAEWFSAAAAALCCLGSCGVLVQGYTPPGHTGW